MGLNLYNFHTPTLRSSLCRHGLPVQVQTYRIFTFSLNPHTRSLPRHAWSYCCGWVNLGMGTTSRTNFLSLDMLLNIGSTMLGLGMCRPTYEKGWKISLTPINDILLLGSRSTTSTTGLPVRFLI